MKQVKMPKWSVRLVAKSAILARSCTRHYGFRSRKPAPSASLLSGQLGFSLLEIMIACVLGGMLIYSAAKMLGASSEYVTESQRKDVEGKLFSSYQAHFKKLTRKAQVSALFFHQPVDLSNSCLDNQVEGPCGFSLRPLNAQEIQDSAKLSKINRACMKEVNLSLLNQDLRQSLMIQLFSDRRADTTSELLFGQDDKGGKIMIQHYPLVDPLSSSSTSPSASEELYAGWRLTKDRPLTMITMARKENYYFTVPLPVRKLLIDHVNSLSGNEIVLRASSEAASVLKSITDTKDPRHLQNLEGSFGLFYASAETRISSIFLISSINQCSDDDVPCKKIVNEMIKKNPNRKGRTLQFPTSCGTYFPCENSITSPTKDYYKIKLTSVNDSAVMQKIETFVRNTAFSQLQTFLEDQSAKFHLKYLGSHATYNFLRYPSLNTSIHQVDALLQEVSGNEKNILIFIPIKFVRLEVKRQERKIIGSITPHSDKEVVIKKVSKEVLNPNDPQNNKVYPILTGITSAKKKTKNGFIYKEKDIIIARKLGSHSRKLSTIIGVLKDDSGQLDQKACRPTSP